MRRHWPQILGIFALVLLIVSVSYLVYKHMNVQAEQTEITSVQEIADKAKENIPADSDNDSHNNGSSVVAELQQHNPECVGWLEIEALGLALPVMETPDEPEKYLHCDFDGNASGYGAPFVGENGDIIQGNSRIIYGHHMLDGSMFASLMSYEDREWAQNAPITLYTLEGKKNYQAVAVLRVDVSQSSHYPFQDKVGSLSFTEMKSFASDVTALAEWSTGFTATDNILMLATCSYGTDNERLVVVAKQI